MIMISAPIAGRLTDQRGSKGVVTIGMILTAIGSAGLLFFSSTVTSPVMWFNLIILGVGLGVFNMLTFVGGTLGLSIFGTLVGSAGFQMNYLIMIICGIVGSALAWKYIPRIINENIQFKNKNVAKNG